MVDATCSGVLLEQEAEVMRRAVAYLSRKRHPKMMYPLALDLASRTAAVRVPVAVTCRVLGFSRQAFYHWRKNTVTQRDRDDATPINAALDVHQDDPEIRVPTDRRRAPRPGPQSEREPRRPTVQPAADLLGVRQEEGPAGPAGPGGA